MTKYNGEIAHIQQWKDKFYIYGYKSGRSSVDPTRYVNYYSRLFVVPKDDPGSIGQAILDAASQCVYEEDVSEVYDEKTKTTRKYCFGEALLSATKSTWRSLAWDGKDVDIKMKGDQATIMLSILVRFDGVIGGQGEKNFISSLEPEELGRNTLKGLSLYKIDPKVQAQIDNTRRKQALRREERAKLKAEKLKSS